MFVSWLDACDHWIETGLGNLGPAYGWSAAIDKVPPCRHWMPKSSDSVARRPMSAEHAATILALVPALPRLPFRIRRTVGLLSFAFRASRAGRMSWTRNHRSNGVSSSIGIEFTPRRT